MMLFRSTMQEQPLTQPSCGTITLARILDLHRNHTCRGQCWGFMRLCNPSVPLWPVITEF